MCNIHIPFKVKFQFLTNFTYSIACQTDTQDSIITDGTGNCAFTRTPTV